MIKGDLYIKRVIANHSVSEKDFLIAFLVAKQLYPLIQKWANPYLSQIIRTGSFAKGTSIKGTTDVDLLISLPSTYPDTLEDIYRSLAGFLRAYGLSVHEQNVSIGVTYKRFSIDLVPAKRQPRSIHDHSIYRRKANTWTKTNVHKHIQLVKGSGRLNEIRGIKIWRELHNLELPSFYLELSVIRALQTYGKLRLSSNLWTVFEYLAYKFKEARIEDPSNSSNIISDDLSKEEKQVIANKAQLTLQQSFWENIIW